MKQRRRSSAGRRRGAALEQAILRAAIDELLESGYEALTMDRVAQRAGTNKNAIYRRWPSRAALAVAAYRELNVADQPLPDTGTLRGDTLELLRRANRSWTSPAGQLRRSLFAGVAHDPELLGLIQERASDAGSSLWLTVVARAVARGEVPPDALHPRVATVAIVLLRNEYVTRGPTNVPDDVLVEIVDAVYLPLLRGRGSAADDRRGPSAHAEGTAPERKPVRKPPRRASPGTARGSAKRT
jgi:AcrR family transcriptional regulator